MSDDLGHSADPTGGTGASSPDGGPSETPSSHGSGTSSQGGSGFWTRAATAVVGAILANLAVWWLGVTFVDVPSGFPPLDGPGPTIFFTAVGAVGAVVVYKLVSAFSSSPDSVFRGIAVVVLLLSFVPDAWLLSAGGREAVPGATAPAVAVLATMHVVAAVIIVAALTGSKRG